MSLNLSDAIVQREAIESDDEYMTPIPAHLRKDSVSYFKWNLSPLTNTWESYVAFFVIEKSKIER